MPKPLCLVIEFISILMLILPLIKSDNNINNKSLLPFYIIYYLGSLPLLYNAYTVNSLDGFVLRLCLFLPLLVLYFGLIGIDRKDVYSLLYKYSNIVCIISVVSLVFWLLGEVLYVIKPTGVFYIEWGGLTGYGHNFFVHFHGQGIRNCGIFTEAPMYSIILCTSLCVEIFLRQQKKTNRIILLVFTILTTLSTTGQLVLLFLLIIKVKDKIHDFSPLFRMLLSSLFLIVFFGIVYSVCFIFVEKMSGFSYYVRYNKMMLEFNAWLESPLFGQWLESPLFGHGHSFYTDGSSNSLTIILAEGGLYLFFLYFLSLVLIPLKYIFRNRSKGYFYLTLFYGLMLMITIVTYTHLTFVFIAMGLSFFIQKKQCRDIY